MESSRIMEFFRDKSVLITGSTGFLAKVFVEKLLRIQPGVKRLYLLIRAADAESAMQRMENEIVCKELFRVVKEKHGATGFQSLVADKLFPVAGDVAEPDLGIQDPHLLQVLFKEVELVVNAAATTNFYGRYDVSLSINVIGAKNTLRFAQNCRRMQMLLHVSTAFVLAGEQKGVVLEKKFEMGETLKRNPNSNIYLDIEEELRLVDGKKRELQLQGLSQESQKAALKEFGRKRAKLFGWPNTYVFTKAMGEMLLGHLRGSTPLVILRPTVITSIYRDPLPGWIEGARSIDSLILGYTRGKVTCAASDPRVVLDVIPADMVVNTMIVTMVVHADQQQTDFIYHVGSSSRHPMRLVALFRLVKHYFLKNHIKLRIFTTLLNFRIYMTLRYKLPIEALHAVNLLSCGQLGRGYEQYDKSYSFNVLLANLYRPYIFFRGRFDDLNLERLRMSMGKMDESSLDVNVFDLDPRSVGDWKDYFNNIHIPGLLKYSTPVP